MRVSPFLMKNQLHEEEQKLVSGPTNDTSLSTEHAMQQFVGTSDLHKIMRMATIKHIQKKLSTLELTDNAQQRDQYSSP
jgi:hypothetical protein